MFKGLGQLGDIAGLMKQAKEMQGKMEEAQAEIEDMQILGEAAGGLVKVTVSGKGKLLKLDIDPTILREDSKEITEDLIVGAIANAQERASEKSKERMRELTEGMSLPEGFQMPF